MSIYRRRSIATLHTAATRHHTSSTAVDLPLCRRFFCFVRIGGGRQPMGEAEHGSTSGRQKEHGVSDFGLNFFVQV
ncbi:hypothetical protein A2U01_0043657 [Trifolium medium]|uniref:Uncharacterized protein n=1 Tax=Trifolium medium TaxID=97028 RepID=A0A392QDR4_9FABA|nr:hypothetical protein [Trifolium medium]